MAASFVSAEPLHVLCLLEHYQQTFPSSADTVCLPPCPDCECFCLFLYFLLLAQAMGWSYRNGRQPSLH